MNFLKNSSRASKRTWEWEGRRKELRIQRAFDRQHRDTKEAVLLGALKARAGGVDVPDENVVQLMVDWLIIHEETEDSGD